MLCYKLTNKYLQTYGGFQWVLGESARRLSGKGKLCGPGWYHVYDHPLLAVLLNTVHANIECPRLFEASYNGEWPSLDDKGMKRGVVTLRLDKEIEVPRMSKASRVRFAIYVARDGCGNKAWNKWAVGWLEGEDRLTDTATSASHLPVDRTANAAARAAANMHWVDTYSNATIRAVADALVFAAEARGSSGGSSERWTALAKKAIFDEAKQSQQRADALLDEMRAP